MPHSSGGGHSSSSSSHSSSSCHSSGGGSSHSGGGSSSKPYVLNHAAKGYSKYAYYKNNSIKYEYLLDESEDDSKLFHIIIGIIFFLFYGAFYAAGIFILIQSINFVKPLSVDYNGNIVINDELGLISPEQQAKMLEEMEEFKQNTGVTLSYQTTYDDIWCGDYDSLIDYSYRLYVDNFEDEKHWLIVYSEPAIQQEPKKWSWEGMQGDLTDDILKKAVPEFNKKYHDKLFRNENYADAFIETVDDLNKLEYGGYNLDKEDLIFPIIWIGFTTFHCIVMCYGFFGAFKKNKKMLKKKREEGIKILDGMTEDKCEYCNGVYIHGVHTSCPHCGAPIKMQSMYYDNKTTDPFKNYSKTKVENNSGSFYDNYLNQNNNSNW